MIQTQQEAIQFLQHRLKIERVAERTLRKLIAEMFLRLLKNGLLIGFSERRFKQAIKGNYGALNDCLYHLRRLLYNLFENSMDNVGELVKQNVDTDDEVDAVGYLKDHDVYDKIDEYTDDLGKEFMIWGLMADKSNWSADELYDAFDDSDGKVYDSPLLPWLKSQTSLNIEPPSSVGNYANASNSLSRLLGGALAFGATELLVDNMDESKILGYMVSRGSSYPCSTCDAMVGFHSVKNAELPPYHNNCKCWFYIVTT